MKKTLLALAITGLFATTAQAASIYEKDGVSIDLTGDVEVQLRSDTDGANKNYINIDDADFGFAMGYDIGHNLTVGSAVTFSGEDGEVSLGDAYVGVSGDFGALTMGKHATILDDAGVGGDYAFGFDTIVSDADFKGKQVIKYKGDFDTFYFGIATILNSGDGEDEGSAVDGNIGVRVAGLDLALFAGTASDVLENDISSMILQATYSINHFDLGAVYATSTTDDAAGDTTADFDAISASVGYTMDKWNFGLGYGVVTDNGDDTSEGTGYANVGYSFTSLVHAFVELGHSDADDAELGYAAGLQVKF